MSDFEGHGWAVLTHIGDDLPGRCKASLHIGTLPGRKSVCLYGHNGNPSVIEVFAYFKTQKKAQVALGILDRLVQR